MYDLIIRNGLVVDGTGADRRVADIAVTDGKIAAVGADLDGDAVETIDAEGLLITPGFVDVHTHYDGQVTWDETLEPTSLHGVTTLVMGNCGVGFAPVRPGSEDWLIQLMEGVEDIPGAALSEGIVWEWETFPEYLDALEKRSWSVDIGTQIPHGSVRAYVMGERGAKNEPADAAEIADMAAIVQEAIAAGALGVSTSRTIGHRAMDGEPVPGTFAAEDELFALGRALRDGGGGVFELAPAGAAGLDLVAPMKEVDWMRRLSAETGQPVTFAMLQVPAAPDLWKEQMEVSLAATAEGAQLHPQVAGRPFGVLIGFETGHPFMLRPTFQGIAHLPIAERIVELRKPEVKAAILREENGEGTGAINEGIAMLAASMLESLYILGDPPDYEPTPDRSVAGLAEVAGVGNDEAAYDAFCAEEGKALLMLPLYNYVDGNHDVIREQLTHPQAVVGLGDGGAHCGLICDASLPTTMISHWTRDRSRGEKLPLEWVVRKQTKDTAALFGMTDRGTIEVGQRADINVIDYERLNLRTPELVYDLPAGGRRLVQKADGYVATMVAGEVTRRNGKDTGARPGRLVRGRR
ncbi:MAG: N-acyl-D-amino-acid deacylase [Candidatus Aldehydirespiratoraceae bacterium]|jgi:N-acyl-D-amino-acid deacylase